MILPIFLGFIISLFLSPQASILRFDREWFTNESFFYEQLIKEQKVKAIHIWSSEKKDGKVFEEEQSFLHYLFNKDGALTRSYKEVRLRNGTDTLMHTYTYNNKSQCIKKVEQLNPFHFIYHYTYKNGQIQSEVKIDGHTNDTSYHHYFKHMITQDRHTKSVYNDAGKVFKFISTQYDQTGNIINKRKTFKRNRSYTESAFIYDKKRLKKIMATKFYNKKKVTISQLNYVDDALQFMNIIENGEVKYKLGFTYNSKGLIDAIVRRIPERRTVSIYRLEYLYYN